MPPPRSRDGTPRTRKPSAVAADVRAERAEGVRDRLDPVGLLHAQLGGAAHDAVAARVPASEREERQLVDEQRHLGGADRRRDELGGGCRGRRPARRRSRRRLKTVMRAPIRSSTSSRPVRRGLRPTPWIVSSEPASSVAATRNGAAEEKSPGISSSPSSSRSAGATVTLRGFRVTRAPAAREHVLGVVARRQRLLDRRLAALGEQPGEEHGGLHLRARDRELVRDRPCSAPPSTVSGARPSVVSTVAPICRERLGDPLHRARAERLVAGELEAALLAGEQAGQQAHQRAGVAAVDRRVRRAQPAQAGAGDAQRRRVVLVDLGRRARGPPRSSTRCRRSGRSRGSRVSPSATAAEQDGAVRDRLVAGHGDVARERGGRLDPHDSSSSSTGATTTP